MHILLVLLPYLELAAVGLPIHAQFAYLYYVLSLFSFNASNERDWCQFEEPEGVLALSNTAHVLDYLVLTSSTAMMPAMHSSLHMIPLWHVRQHYAICVKTR